MTKPDLRSLTFSVTQARAQLGCVVDLAAQGHAVQLTRRGRTVAVVVPDHGFQAHPPEQGGWFQFCLEWCEQMVKEGLSFLSEDELKGFRDEGGGSDQLVRRGSPFEG